MHPLYNNHRYFNIIILINTVFLLFRIFYLTFDGINLTTEEAQYWLWSKFPDISYYSKPPLVAYMNYLSTTLLGDIEMAVKINAILIGFITPVILYRATDYFFRDKKIAFVSALIFLFMPFYHYNSMFFVPDSPLFLFWLLTLYLFWKAYKEDKTKYWIFAGVTFGMGILSKYTMFIFYPAVFAYVIFSRKDVLYRKGFYLFLFISVLFTTPIIVWNIQHDFVGFQHVFHLSKFNQASIPITKSILGVVEYVGSQLLVISPFFLFAYAKQRRKISLWQKNAHTEELTFLVYPVAVTLLAFFIVSTRKIEINWPIYSYSGLSVIIGYVLTQNFNKKNIVNPIIITSTISLVLLFPGAFDKVGLSNIYPAKLDALSRFADWTGLADFVHQRKKSLNNDNVFVFSDSYHLSSELSFYIKDTTMVFCVNDGRRMNQFDLWPDINQYSYKGYDAVYVSKHQLSYNIRIAFKEVLSEDVYWRQYRNTDVKKYYVYTLKSFKKFQNKNPESY